MNKMIGKRVAILAVCIILVLAVAGSAMAAGVSITDVSAYGMATQTTVVKTAPGDNYTTLGWLQTGTVVKVVGLVSNGWLQINFNGYVAYVNGIYITTNPSGGTSSYTGTYYATSAIRMYSAPRSDSSELAVISVGQLVYKTGIVGSWAQINYGGLSGYVNNANLAVYTGSYYYNTPVSGGLSNAIGATHTVTAAKLNVRSGPSTKYGKLGYLLAGSTVKRVDTSGKWSKIEYNGSYGYVYSQHIKALGSSGGSGSGSTSSTVYVYAGPGINYSVVGVLGAGDRVNQLGSVGNWIKVTNGVVTGYVEASVLVRNTYSAVTPGYYYVNTASLNVRTGPGTNYSVLGTVMKGQVVTVTGRSGNWAQINFNGTTAYVHAGYISSGVPSGGYYYNYCGGQPLYIFQ